MSKAALSWYRRQHIEDQSASAVLQVLARLHFENADLFPAQKTIAEKAQLSYRTVWTALRLLAHFGIITRRGRFKEGLGRTSDVISLSMTRDFTVTKTAIRAARKSLTTPSQILRHPLANFAKDKKFSTTTGLIQEGSEVSSDTLRAGADCAARPWTGFKVIAGGRS